MVLEHGAHALHHIGVALLHRLDEVIVLHGEVVGAELERAARGGELGGLHRRRQRAGLRRAGRRQRRVEDQRGVVALGGVERGGVAVFRLEGGDEGGVDRVVEVARPLRAGEHPEGRVLRRRQGRLVHGEGREERHVEPRLRELAHEVHAHAAGHEGVDRIRFQRGDAGQFGGEVELAELGEDLVGDFAFVEALDARHRVLAGLVVRRDQDEAAIALLGRVAAEHFVVAVVLPGDVEVMRMAAAPGERGGPGVGADQHHAGVDHRLEHRHHHIGEHGAHDDVGAVALDQRLGLADGHVGLQLVVHHDQVDVEAAELAAALLQRELEAVADVGSEGRGRARQRQHHADVDLLGLRRGGGQPEGERGAERARLGGGHRFVSLCAPPPPPWAQGLRGAVDPAPTLLGAGRRRKTVSATGEISLRT